MLLSKNIGLLSLYSTIYFQQVFVPSSITITPTTINDPYLNYVVLNINGDTALSGNNNTFLDSGFRNITPNGNVTQGAFSPFSPAGWSGYFDGTSYLTTPWNSSLTFGTGDFTVECWVNVIASGFICGIWNDTNKDVQSWLLGIDTTTGPYFVINNTSSWEDRIKTTSTVISTNSWYHLAVTRSGNNWYMFLNGALMVTNAAVKTIQAGSNLFTIGRRDYPVGGGFTGYISNLRVIKGTALYTTTFTTNSAEPLKLLPNTSILTLQDNRFVDNSRNNFTLSVDAGTPQIQPFSPIAPAVDYTPSLHGGSAYFDGNTSFLTNATNLNFSGVDWTIEAYVYTTVANGAAIIQSTTGTNNWIAYLSFAITSDLKIRCGINAVAYTSTQTIRLNEWTHLALIRSAGIVKLYINGIASSISQTSDINNSNLNFFIGKSDNYDPASGGINYHNGYISNLRVIKGQAVYTSNFTPPSRPVTATSNGGASVGTTAVPNLSVTPSLLLDFDNGGIIDRSYKNNALVFGDAKTQTLSSKFGTGSLFFDGTGDYLAIPSSDTLNLATGDFTVEAWINTSTIATGAGNVIGRYSTTIVGMDTLQYAFYRNGSSLIVRPYQGTVTDYTINVGTIAINTWYHVALVRSGNTFSGYLNGVRSGTTYTITGSLNNNINWNGVIISGGPNASVWNGYIEDIRITKGVARYTGASFTPPSKLQANNSDPYYSNVVLFLDGNNIGSNVNNEFRATAGDAARLAITRTGATQGSFSPYSPNGWSGFFNGINNYLTIASNAVFAFPNDFTIEMWVNLQSFTNNRCYETIISDGAELNFTGGTPLFGKYGVSNVIASSSTINLNTWYHIAVSRSGTNTRIFVNGVQTGINTNDTHSYVQGSLRIGADGTPTYYHNGYISNLRVVKGLAVYTSNFTPPTGPLPSLSGSGFSTSLLTLQDNRFKDNSPNNFTLSVGAGTPSVQAFNPYKQSTAYSPTLHGGSGYFNGSSYLTVPANAAFSFGTATYTVEAWVYLTARNTTWGSQIIGGHNYGSNPDFLLYVNTAGNLIFQAVNTSITSTQTIPLNTWTHVAFINSGQSTNTTYSLYINGVQQNTTVASPPTISSTINIAIGSSTNNDAGARLTGYISNLRIVKGRALYTSNFTPPTSPVTAVNGTSLLLNFDNGYAIDSTGNNVITTVGNSRTDVLSTAPLSSSTGSLYFDGTANTYITGIYNDLYAFPSGTPFTIECWFNIKANTTETSKNAAIINTAKSTGFDGYGLYILGDGTNTGTGIRFQQYGASGDAESITATINLNKNTWYHLALVRNNLNQYSIYINGQSLTITGSIPTYPNIYGTNFRIGANNEVAFISLFNGYIDDFRITKGIARYTSNFTPQTYENPTSNILTYPTDPFRNLVVLDLNADTVNNEQNNTFLDRSGNNLTITRSGSTTQGSFSPFSPTGWSGYFDGSSRITIPNNSSICNLGTQDFTIEAWIYRQTVGINTSIASCYTFWNTTAGNVAYYFYIHPSNVLYFTANNSSQYINGTTILMANVWYHVAVSRQGTTFKMFVNGTLEATWTPASLDINNSADLKIGQNSLNGESFTGYISNLRIVKGQALYTNTFTPPTAALTTTSTVSGVTLSAENVSLLTLQDNRFKDNSNNNFTITPNGTPSVKPFSPFQPTANYSPTVHGGSGYFNGGSYLNTPTTLSLGNSNFTFECWIYYIQNSKTQNTILYLNGTSSTAFAALRISIATKTLSFLCSENGTSHQFAINSSITIEYNNWTHISVIRTGLNVYLYVNGIIAGKGTLTSETASLYNGSTNYIGNLGYTSDWSFTGYISNLRIVKGVAITPPVGGPTAPVQAVSGTSLLLNFDNAGVVDSTGKNNVTTFDNAKVDYAIEKYGTGALKFDGTNDYMQVGTASDWTFLHSPSTKWTIEFWVYNNSSAIGTLLDTNGSTLGAHGISLQKKDNNTLDLFVTNNTTGNFVIRATTTATIPLSTWTHVAITYDHSLTSNNMIVYFNGLSSLAVTKTTQTPSTTVPANTLSIGAYGNGAAQFFNGSIDELRITNAVRYTGNFPLTSYSQLSDPNQVSITYLIVGGGGGGGGGEYNASGGGGGGGGGGGLLYSTSNFDIGTVLPIVIGAGGNSDTKGADSSLGIISVSGGGYGGGDNAHVTTNSGGSGGNGGGGSGDGPDRSGGISLYSIGYSGGSGNISGKSGGGGGGSSQKGFDATASGGGNGGNGASYPITASNNTYAGGGGGGRGGNLTVGGTGGTGGGGNGGNSTTAATAGSANTGGGGGGGRSLSGGSVSQPGASGGSGIVILSVPTRLFSNKVSGNPTITVIGDNTIITYNNSGSYTV